MVIRILGVEEFLRIDCTRQHVLTLKSWKLNLDTTNTKDSNHTILITMSASQGGYKIDGEETLCELRRNKGVLLNTFVKNHNH